MFFWTFGTDENNIPKNNDSVDGWHKTFLSILNSIQPKDNYEYSRYIGTLNIILK